MKIGIDLGGTKTEIICLDDTHQELYRHRVASPQNDYQQTLSMLVSLIDTAEVETQTADSIGLGIPGIVDSRTGLVKNSNSTWINGQPLQQDLEAKLGRSVCIANDANCLALSEATDGVAAGKAVVFGVIIGTGCGGGLVVDGKMIAGANGIAGEWGHNPLPFPKVLAATADPINYFDGAGANPVSAIYAHKGSVEYTASTLAECEFPGPQCYCGKRGCLETWLSGPGFSRDYLRLTGTQSHPSEIIQAMREGNAQAQAVFSRYCERLAKSLAQIINILDPDVIVLGGGMSNIPELYTEVVARWDRYIFSTETTTELLPATHGDSSGVRGAAFLE